MNKHKKITHRTVKVLIIYDPEKGTMIWCARMRGWFQSVGSWKSWNKQHAWKPAMASVVNGHLCGSLLGKPYLTARVAYFYMKGRWPKVLAFHDGDSRNLRWDNLVNCKSAADARDYMRYHTGKRVGNTRKTATGRWRARLGSFYVGTFDTRRDALAAINDVARMRWPDDPCR